MSILVCTYVLGFLWYMYYSAIFFWILARFFFVCLYMCLRLLFLMQYLYSCQTLEQGVCMRWVGVWEWNSYPVVQVIFIKYIAALRIKYLFSESFDYKNVCC